MLPELIGLSLSFCIRDICLGRVQYEQVSKIITSTKAPTKKDFSEVVDHYVAHYWEKFPEQAIQLAWRFWREGKIDQPRTRGEEAQNIADGHWLKGGKVIRLS